MARTPSPALDAPSTARRRVRTVLATAAVTTGVMSALVIVNAPAALAAPPTLATPDRVYPSVNTTMPFTGSDPVSGDSRVLSVSGMVEGVGGCNPTAGNNYSVASCPRIQMSLNTAQVGGEGLLRLPNNTPVNLDADPEYELFIAQSGAIITEATDPNGGDSVLFNFNGTQTQINNTLGALSFVPATDYEEKDSDDGNLLTLQITAIQGDVAAENVSRDVKLKIEGTNNGPTLSVPLSSLSAPAGASTQYDNEADVIDEEMCNFTICGNPFTNPGLKETDDEMVLVAWLADPDCGTFNFLAGAVFSTLGGPTRTSVHTVLTDVSGEDLEDAQAAKIEASLSPTALLLDLSTQPASVGSPTTVFAGVAGISDARYALEHIVYNAPAMDKSCALNISVSDMGNNGTPFSFVGSTLGGNPELPEPGYEVPNALGDTKSITFSVHDTHPDVTVEQTVPGPVPGVDPTSTAAQFTVTFNEAVEGFDASDVDLSDSTATGASALVVPVTPGLVYSITAIATGDGKIIAKIPAGAAYALGHNGDSTYDSAASTSSDNEVTWDQTKPKVTIDQKVGQADPASMSPIVFTVKIDETISSAPLELTEDDIDLSASTAGGTLVATVTQPDLLDLKTYEVAVTGMTTSGNVVASVKANAILDRALNGSEASTSTDNTVTWDASVPDNTQPDVTIEQKAGQADPTSTSPIEFTATFTEPVTGFTGSDVDLSASTAGGTLVANVSGGPSVYNVAVSGMTTNGNVSASIPAMVAQDAATNGNTASTSTDNTVAWVEVVDITKPSVTINQKGSQVDPTSTSPIQFTVTFNEPVSGFIGTDVDLSTSTAGGTLAAAVAGGPSIYTVSVTGMTTAGAVVATIPAGVAADAAANTNFASTSSDNSVTWQVPDNTPPTVTIDQGAAQSDPTGTSPIVFDVLFSESVSDFVTGDVTLGGTAGATTAIVSGSGTTYTVSVSGMTQSGTVVPTIASGKAHDAANNPNDASTSTDNEVTYNAPVVDNTPPTVTINQGGAQSDPTGTSPIVFDVVFSESVSDFVTGDVTLGGTAGATTAIVAGSGTTYTVSVSGMTQSGTVTASITAGTAHDAANNPNDASTSTDNQVTYNAPVVDNIAPAVTINQAAGQADPTTSPSVQFSVVFTEAVTGFATGDVTIGGTAGATTAIVSGSGASYTVDVSGMTQSGTVTASIGAGVATDAANNPNTASTSGDNSVQFNQPVGDVTSPSVTIEQAAGQADPTGSAPITFSVLFSEPVGGFSTGDVTISGTAGATLATVSGSGASYTVLVSGMTQSGTVTVSIPAGIAADASNNLNLASTSSDNTVTYSLGQTISTPGGDVSISVVGGQLLTFSSQPPQVPPPNGVFFPYGQLSFSATSAPNGLVTFTLVLPASPIDYWKLNGNVWQSFTWDGETGAQISGNIITITIRDNGRGDSDPTLGVAADPGVPVFPSSLLPATGQDVQTLLWLAAMAVTAGVVLVVARTRRRSVPVA